MLGNSGAVLGEGAGVFTWVHDFNLYP